MIKLLKHHGVSKAVISPGSRNAPIIRALLDDTEIETHLLADERSAAFTAMGMALQEQKPALVCCTSGTATINLYPAICEAWYSNIPLIAITADRPNDLIDQWDGQCIHQQKLYEPHVGDSIHFDTSEPFKEQLEQAAPRIAECLGLKKPLHLNIALKEPLYMKEEVAMEKEQIFKQQPTVLNEFRSHELDQLKLPRFRKIMVVYGAHSPAEVRHEWPKGCVVLSDIISGQRDLQNIEQWDTLMTSKSGISEAHIPDLLITCGMYVLSKGLKKLLKSSSDYTHVHIDHGQGFGNMYENKTIIFKTQHAHKLVEELSSGLSPDKEYYEIWKQNSEAVKHSLNSLLRSNWSDWHAVQFISKQLNQNNLVHVSNSMPVRYLSLLDALPLKTNIHCNRGTSGIDGCTSTALGASLCTDQTTYLITGDVAFFYDINALWNEHLHPKFKIILLNNGGGNIFSMIDGPEKFPKSLHYQESPHHRTAAEIAQSLNLVYFTASDASELSLIWKRFNEEKEQPAILEIFTNKTDNITFYHQLKQS
jgi:2-succinyl-5-enolpyruvyl-6-hydroxy-3-cyclohexene-1-carboxylate synthase